MRMNKTLKYKIVLIFATIFVSFSSAAIVIQIRHTHACAPLTKSVAFNVNIIIYNMESETSINKNHLLMDFLMVCDDGRFAGDGSGVIKIFLCN